MISPKRAVERSLYSIAKPELAEKRQQEINQTSGFKRIALGSLHYAVKQNPRMAAQMAGFEWPLVELLSDDGTHFQVFKQIGANQVTKVYRNSRAMDAESLASTAERLQQEHDIMASYLGSAVLPHYFSIGKHPINKTPALLIDQPLCAFEPVNLLSRASDIPQIATILEAKEVKYPGTLGAVQDILTANRAMVAEENLCVDLIGYNNAGNDIHTGAFVIVDSQPSTPHHGDIIPEARTYCDNIQTAIDLINGA